MRVSPLAFASLGLFLIACGGDVGSGGDGSATPDAASSVDASGTGGARADAMPTAVEVCNSIDDDGNGKIDDIDVGGDGICDCLRIATIGVPGIWGEGDVFSGWLEGKSDNGAFHLTPAGSDPEITAQSLAGYQILVVQDASVLNTFTQAEVDAVAQWVEGGGGLMTLIGYADASERENVNALLAPMNLSYDAAPILGGSPTVPVDDEWMTHPTTEAISAVGVDNGYAVVDGDGTGTVVAREGGHDVAIVKSYGAGKVFVWGDEWITYNSEWNQTSYQVEQFWLNVINWLTPELECEIENIIL